MRTKRRRIVGDGNRGNGIDCFVGGFYLCTFRYAWLPPMTEAVTKHIDGQGRVFGGAILGTEEYRPCDSLRST